MSVENGSVSMPDELPDGWRWAQLGELAKYINGRAFKPSDWGTQGLPIIRIQNLNNPNARFNYFSKPVEERYVVREGDLLISWSASLDAFVWSGETAVLNQHIFKVEPNHEIVSKLYLYYVVRAYLQTLKDQTHGTGMQHITRGPFEATKIPLAPLSEQHNIVTKIESHLAELRTAHTALGCSESLVKKFRQSVLSAALRGKLFESEGIWEQVTLGRVINSLQYGTSVKADADSEAGVPVLRMGNIQDGKLSFTKLKFIDRSKEDIPKYRLQKGDILINRTNSPELVGKAALFSGEGEYLFASYLIRLCVNPTLILPEYLNAIINSDIGRQHVATVKHQVAGQANINSQDIRAMPIPLPPLAEQQRIVERVKSLFARAAEIERAVEIARRRTDKMEQAILARAFRGEL